MNAKVVSFADDTQRYLKISYVGDCDSVQSDLNCVYDWSKTNNKILATKMFSTNVFITSDYVNAFVNPNFYVIENDNDLKDLEIIMFSSCSYEQHIIELCKRCTSLCGWILRTFGSRESTAIMALFKSLVLSRLDYGSQLCSPTKIHKIILLCISDTRLSSYTILHTHSTIHFTSFSANELYPDVPLTSSFPIFPTSHSHLPNPFCITSKSENSRWYYASAPHPYISLLTIIVFQSHIY